MSDFDVLKVLPKPSFRGITFPVTSRNYSFSHDNVQHKFAYRNGELIETTGTRSPTFRYTVPMRQGIAVGPYENLFSVWYPKLVAAIADKSPGILVDPLRGARRVVPTSLSDDTDPNKRDGTDLTIEFVESPELDDIGFQDEPNSIQGVDEESARIDEEIERVDWKQETPPPPTVDPIDAVAGFGRQIEFIGNKNLAKLERRIASLERVENAVDKLSDPKTFALKRRARRARMLAIRAKDRAQNPFGVLDRITTDYTQTVVEIATDAGMTVAELIRVNQKLAPMTEVPQGTHVFVRRRTNAV